MDNMLYETEKKHISEDFLLGSSISSWQYEGNLDGKYVKKNFMEKMYEVDKENWINQYGPDLAIDFLNNCDSDADLAIEIGLQSLRFTIDWTRFYIDMYKRELNMEYIDTYLKFAQKLKKNNIKLFLILEHWDMPFELQEKYKGYVSPVVQELFINYAEDVFKIFNGIIDYYMIFNEPIVIPQLCFIERFWAPKECDLKYAIRLMHAKNIISAQVIRHFREKKIIGEIGIGGINIEPVKVRDINNEEDIVAGEIAGFFSGQMFLDPFINKKYNQRLIDFLEREQLMFNLTEKDIKLFESVTIDFVGVNYYHPIRVCKPTQTGSEEGFAKYFSVYNDVSKRINKDRGWEIKPEGLFDIGMIFKNEYNNIKWFVNENGFGTEENNVTREEGVIVDDYRSAFINEHVYQLMLINKNGGNCFGYHTWSFLDNCSPYNAMKNRYGFIEVDIDDNYKRIPKKSFYYYKELISNRAIENNLFIEDYT